MATSIFSEAVGVSLRHLHVLRILWDAGKPLPRHEILEKLHDLYGEPIEDVTLRVTLRNMGEKGLVEKAPGPKPPDRRRLTVYSAKPSPREVVENLLEAIFADALGDEPTYLGVAARYFEARLGED